MLDGVCLSVVLHPRGEALSLLMVSLLIQVQVVVLVAGELVLRKARRE